MRQIFCCTWQLQHKLTLGTLGGRKAAMVHSFRLGHLEHQLCADDRALTRVQKRLSSVNKCICMYSAPPHWLVSPLALTTSIVKTVQDVKPSGCSCHASEVGYIPDMSAVVGQ